MSDLFPAYSSVLSIRLPFVWLLDSHLTLCHSSARQVHTSNSSPSRPATPRPRPPMMTSHSDSMAVERVPPAIPPRHTKPGAFDLSRSHSIDISTESPLSCAITSDASPRIGGVGAMRDLFRLAFHSYTVRVLTENV